MKKRLRLISGLVLLFCYSCSFNQGNTGDSDRSSQDEETLWSDGEVINAESGSSEDIIEALENAEAGDNILIPAGTFYLEERIDLEAGVNIIGAGIDETVFQKTGDWGPYGQPFFRIDGSNGLPVGISKMTIIGEQLDGSDRMDMGIRLDNGCQDFRISQVRFESLGQAGISVIGNSRGVVDNCQFINIYRPAIGNFGYGVSVMGDGDEAWDRPLVLGDENAVFVEDCYFIGNRHAIASNFGSRYVFRYNLVEDNGGEGAWVQAVDAHGPGYGSSRGSRSYEVYGNTIDNANTTCWVAMYIRGGDGVIFNNNISGGISTAPIMLVNDSDSSTYPALDQIRELYLWDNFYEGTPTEPTNWSSETDEEERVVQEDRDYFNHERPGYTPYTYPHPLRNRD